MGGIGFDTGVPLIDNTLNGTNNQPVPVSYAPAVDYSSAAGIASNDSKTVALAQILGQAFQMQQTSMDREMQSAAHLELSLETLDTKLEMGRLEFVQHMQAEENRHQEKLAAMGAQLGQLTANSSTSPDLPPPPAE